MLGMGATVEALHQAVDAVAAVDLDTLTDGESDTELVDLVRLRHRLDAELARRAARWDTRGVWRSDGSRAQWGPAVPHRQPVPRRRQTDAPSRP